MSIKLEGTRVDIDWYDRENGILGAKLYRGKKKNSGVKFKIKTKTLNGIAECKNCPFKTNTYLCGKLLQEPKGFSSLCSALWEIPGNNMFPGRNKVHVFSPIPL